jgi:citrate lyase subunit beta-like protein
MGATRTPDARELLYARTAVVTHAVACGLQSIDMVCLDFKNNDVLFKETVEGRQMGYTGKQAIHPNQIDTIYNAFLPSNQELTLAKRITEEWEKYKVEGKGAFSIDGKMMDLPMVKWAQRIMLRARYLFITL